MSAPIKKNDDITLEITGMSSEGAGIGRYEGFAVFVPFAIKGETVSAHVIKVTDSYAAAKLNEVIVPSENRVVPSCASFGKCGGCVLQHMSMPSQLEFKRQLVVDALERIGGFSGVEVRPVIGMSEPERYRNKGSFPFASVDGKPIWGMYAARSHRLIETDDCMIENSLAVHAAEAVRKWAESNRIPVYDEKSGKGVLRHVAIRSLTDGAAVCVVTTGKLPNEKDLVERLRTAVPAVRSIVHNVNSRNTNVILGSEFRLIWGEESVRQTICGLDFSVSAESFLQVNIKQTEKLYDLAVSGLGLTKDMTAADIFCGIGTITLLLAQKARNAVGIEYVPKAIEDAKNNAVRNGIDNVEFYAGAAEDVLPRLISDGRRFDAITLDPPRKGADPAVLQAIAASGAERIAYVSCSPATLARDLKLLCGYGYKIDSVHPVDMFPHTAHVETVVLLSQQRPNDKIRVELDLTEFDITTAEKEATYQEIKDYVFEKHGIKVSSLYIAQVKEKLGIKERENYYFPKDADAKQPQCPKDKERLIVEALKHFKMIAE